MPFSQLGFGDMINRFVPSVVKCCDPKRDWQSISGGQHHALLLDNKGMCLIVLWCYMYYCGYVSLQIMAFMPVC